MSQPDDVIGFKPRYELSATFVVEQGGELVFAPAPNKQLVAEFAPFFKGEPGAKGDKGDKGDPGNGIDNFSGDPLTHFILAIN